MSAAVYDLVLEQGEDYEPVWEMFYPSTNLPFDLTPYTSAELQIRSDYSSSSTLADLSTTAGTIALGGAAGTIALTLAGSVTAAWFTGPSPIPISQKINNRPVAKFGVYDLRLYGSGGALDPLVLMGGSVYLTPSVTRSA